MIFISNIIFTFILNFIYCMTFDNDNNILDNNILDNNILDNNNIYYMERYMYYKNKYRDRIQINEIKKMKVRGYFNYIIKKNDICKYAENILINQTDYFNMFKILIHELTHYIQCIYSEKYNKNMSSVTNKMPNNYYVDFVKTAYKIQDWDMEFEAFYYQSNYENFKDLEKFISF